MLNIFKFSLKQILLIALMSIFTFTMANAYAYPDSEEANIISMTPASFLMGENLAWIIEFDKKTTLDVHDFNLIQDGEKVDFEPLYNSYASWNLVNYSPEGIEYVDGKFYVLDKDQVIVYKSTGVKSKYGAFMLDEDNTAARGLAYHEGKFYITDTIDGKVYVYDMDGTRSSMNDFDTEISPRGITVVDDKFYVISYGSNQAHAYDLDGIRADGDIVFDFKPTGITYMDDKFYVAKYDNNIYVYDMDGNIDISNIKIDSDNKNSYVLTHAEGKIFILDGGDYSVYEYERQEATVTAKTFIVEALVNEQGVYGIDIKPYKDVKEYDYHRNMDEKLICKY